MSTFVDTVKRLFAANRRKLSLVDCASFECMRRFARRRAFAFDDHFMKERFDSAT